MTATYGYGQLGFQMPFGTGIRRAIQGPKAGPACLSSSKEGSIGQFGCDRNILGIV